MSKYTAEQVREHGDFLENHGYHKSALMLLDYAQLLREREQAKQGVTDEVVERACEVYFGEGFWPDAAEEAELCRIFMRYALEDVWPVGSSHE